MSENIQSPTEPAAASLLQVRDLKVSMSLPVGDVMALNGVSFSVEHGETLGLVGESGSGKSLTASTIIGMLPNNVASIAGGSVKLDGEEILGAGESVMRQVRGRRIGMILQDPHTSLNPVFSIGEQIAEVFRLKRGRRSRQETGDEVIGALEAVRIAAAGSRVKDYPHQMSGGMKQRVVGAVALAGTPDLIIADEPTTALDVTVQSQYLRLIKDIQAESNVGVIFITHDFGIVAKICDKVAVMYGGRIVEYGAVRDVFDNPSHPYTQALLDSVPDIHGRRERLHAIQGQPPSLFDIIEGCRFSPRCAHRFDKCSQEPPVFACGTTKGSEQHRSACWLREPK